MIARVESSVSKSTDSGSKSAGPSRPLVVALAGNPNAGKTTLFNALTGLRQKVANYPGVTVERKEGIWNLARGNPPARLIDLPGLYSLDAASLDEEIARGVIAGQIAGTPAPDVIVAVVDATNLERNLFLVTQLLEFGGPVVVALTMVDMARRNKLEIDATELASELGIHVVPITAAQNLGLDALAAAVCEAVECGNRTPALFPTEAADNGEGEHSLPTTELPTYLKPATHITASETYSDNGNGKGASEVTGWQEPLLARYRWIEVVASRVTRGDSHKDTLTAERIDRVLTHRIAGPIILILVMLLVFQAIFSWATLPMDLIDKGFGTLGDIVRANMTEGLLTDLFVDGVIAGVGGVLVFLPQILLLFFFIAILEDTGYMARAAFLMDRIMRGVGLHGKAFMPLLSSFACAIPGIMATRTIENPKDRIATIMIAPFMSCSARLPVYTLMIAAFFSSRKLFGFLSVGAFMIMAMYLLGIVVAVIVAWVLKRTILKAPTPPLVMELPPYRVPNFRTIFQAMLSRSGLFIKRAGTVILAISIILWALVTFPRIGAPEKTATQSAASANQNPGAAEGEKGEQLRHSFAGRAGHILEPIIAPLGFDWKMGVALIASFAAREVLVSTLSIIYNVGSDADAKSDSLISAVRDAKRLDGSPAWTPLVALSMMVFFVLACQCMSTVAIVRRETNSWRWPLFMVAYMTVIAYIASFITFQGGRLLGFG